MSADIIDINERAREVWDAYLEAKERAEYTRSFQDARRAGLLWGCFLNLYSRDPEPLGKIIAFTRKSR